MKTKSPHNAEESFSHPKYTRRFQALFKYASVGILLTDATGDIIMINDFALKQFGYRTEEVLGKKMEVLIPETFHSNHVKYRNDYNHNSQSRPMGHGSDLHAMKKDGSEFTVEVSLSHYKNDEGSFVIAFINDITERIKSKQKIVKLNNELETTVEARTKDLQDTMQHLEASRNELTKSLKKEKDLGDLKSKFVSIASHQFRTPLSTILSSIYLISKYPTTEEQPKRERHIQRIISSANMLTEILNDFLSLGKMEEGKIQIHITQIKIKNLVAEITDEIQSISKPEQKIKYTHSGDEDIYLDASLLKHVMMNLLSNAVKFSPDNSLIDVKTAVHDGIINLIVSDAGIGIPAEEQHHLFERFYRASNADNIQGTGLGLHIVKRYIELMDGKIECTSQQNKGTTIKIIFNNRSQ